MHKQEVMASVRQGIVDIQQLLEQIFFIAPSLGAGNNESFSEQILSCQCEFKKASIILESPALRIATIGTTSAGKSTLVNALVGRKVAPMDAGELSAGVLHLVHNQERYLKINAVEGIWGEVDTPDWSDEETYTHVRESIFKPYHQNKVNKTIKIPQININGPLYLNAIFELPESVGLEIYDLPGLNSINDIESLKVIQEYLAQCFCLVVMDYSQTDKSNREKLLKEISDVVKKLGNRTDTLVFALNRIDKRNQDDDPLEDRINEFSAEIQRELDLEQPVNIIPIHGLAYYYAQCAWGSSVAASTTSLAIKKENLRKFMTDCGKFIKEHQKKDPNIKQWLRDIEDAEEELKDIPDHLLDDDAIGQWLIWLQDNSGASALWHELNTRVTERFSEVVVAPVLINPCYQLNNLLTLLSEYEKIQREENTNNLKQRIDKLKNNFDKLQVFLNDENKDFQRHITTAIDNVSIAMSQSEVEISESLSAIFSLSEGEPEPAALVKLRQLEGQIAQDLQDQILLPVKEHLESPDSSIEDLKERLSSLPADIKLTLCRKIEKYQRRGMVGNAINDGIHKKVRLDNKEEIKELEHLEKTVRALFQAMRDAFSVQAEFILQSNNYLIMELQKLLRQQGIAKMQAYVNQNLPNEAGRLLSYFENVLAERPLDPLPSDMFELPAVESNDKMEREQTGVKDVTMKRSCFDDTETRPIYDDIGYRYLTLPNVADMACMWNDGIESAKKQLWLAFNTWFTKSIEIQSALFHHSAQQVHKELQTMLEYRLQQSVEEHQQRLQELDSLLVLQENIIVVKQQLDSCRTSNVGVAQ